MKNNLIAAAVLSGNRNFEARVHQNIKANFLMSPPLVVAFALAGRVDIDLGSEPLGTGKDGTPVPCRFWPTLEEVRTAMESALQAGGLPQTLREFCSAKSEVERDSRPARQQLRMGPPVHLHPGTAVFRELQPGSWPDRRITGARALGLFGDSVTTDHISPAGSIKQSSPAGKYLLENGVSWADFNSYGSRRGNDRMMTRGTFANVRIKNLMLGGEEGGHTLLPHHRMLPPDGRRNYPSLTRPCVTKPTARRSS